MATVTVSYRDDLDKVAAPEPHAYTARYQGQRGWVVVDLDGYDLFVHDDAGMSVAILGPTGTVQVERFVAHPLLGLVTHAEQVVERALMVWACTAAFAATYGH